ncbi:MAG: hypothetical protein RLZZ336_1058 [Cyanobacteriota bacterium]
MELPPQTIALHRPFVDLGADHNPTAPGCGLIAIGIRWDQALLGGHPAQHHGFTMNRTPPFVQGIKNTLAPQPVSLGQGQGIRPPGGRDRGGGGP